MASNSRYQGKPLLRLLECYVLWVIAALPDKEAMALKEMTPKLQSIYHVSGDWHQIVASAVQLPSNMPTLIRELSTTVCRNVCRSISDEVKLANGCSHLQIRPDSPATGPPMKDDAELYAIDENGRKVLGPVLEPFWKTVFCAFLNKADEITVRASREYAGDLGVTYQKGKEIVHLTPTEDFHPFVASSRIRLISGMAIAPDIAQNGKMRVKLNHDVLTIEVRIEVENGHETLRLIPQWK